MQSRPSSSTFGALGILSVSLVLYRNERAKFNDCICLFSLKNIMLVVCVAELLCGHHASASDCRSPAISSDLQRQCKLGSPRRSQVANALSRARRSQLDQPAELRRSPMHLQFHSRFWPLSKQAARHVQSGHFELLRLLPLDIGQHIETLN